MTAERRQLVSVDEITSIELECKTEDCRAKTTLRIDQRKSVPSNCPICGAKWFISQNDDKAWGAIEGVHKGLSSLTDGLERSLGCSIRLELRAVIERG
jgi:hypothetical protein